MKSSLQLISYFLLLFTSSIAQDPHFSQPSVGNVHLNPALAGNDSIGRVGIVYRNQWPNLSGNYVTTSVNGYQYIPKLNAYAGIIFLNDIQANTIYSNNFSLFYGQNINIKQLLIRPAIEIGVGSLKLDWTKLNFGGQVEPRRNFTSQWGSNTATSTYLKYIDVNIGMMSYYKNFILGLSAHHINQPDVGLLGPSKLPVRFNMQFGYQLSLKKITLSPYLIYQQQQNFTMLMGGINTLLFKHLNIGLSYRNSDAFIAALGYQNSFLRITYSYDNTMSKLGNYNTGGSHEISTIFNFWKTSPKKRLIKINSIFS